MADVKKALAMQFEVKDMGELHYFLGVKIVQDHQNGMGWIGQPAYTDSMLHKYGMVDAKPVTTPVESSSKLIKTTEECETVDQVLYQSAVGTLLYLSVGTRPDITFAVSNVAKYCAKPNKQHWVAVKRILIYLRGTLNFGILCSNNGSKECIGY